MTDSDVMVTNIIKKKKKEKNRMTDKNPKRGGKGGEGKKMRCRTSVLTAPYIVEG